MTAQIDINELHRRFWEQRQTDINELLTKPYLVSLVADREAEKALFVKSASTEAIRIERIRNQRLFECELQSAADEFASLPVIKAQRRRAKRPRGKVTDDGKTLNQVIEILVCRPEHLCLSAPLLWPHLCAKLDSLDLDPKEMTHPIDPRKSAFSYEFIGKRKTITYGRFANLVSKCRKKSR